MHSNCTKNLLGLEDVILKKLFKLIIMLRFLLKQLLPHRFVLVVDYRLAGFMIIVLRLLRTFLCK